MLTKKEVRKQFGAIGYKASFKKHGLIDNAVKLFVTRENVAVVGNFNVYTKQLYETHKAAIDLAKSFQGQILESGEKII